MALGSYILATFTFIEDKLDTESYRLNDMLALWLASVQSVRWLDRTMAVQSSGWLDDIIVQWQSG